MSWESNMHPGWLVALSVPNLSSDRGLIPALALLTHLPTGLWRARGSYTRPTVSGAFTQEDAARGFGVMRDVSVSTNHSPVTWMDFFSSLETKSCKAAERINWRGTTRLFGLYCSLPFPCKNIYFVMIPCWNFMYYKRIRNIGISKFMSFLKGHNKHLYSFCSLLPRQTYICYSLYSSLLQNLVFNFFKWL